MHAGTYGSAFPFANQAKGEEGRSFRRCRRSAASALLPPVLGWELCLQVLGKQRGGSRLDEHMRMMVTARSQCGMPAMGSAQRG